jgi:Rrf2 family protein
MTPNSYLGCKEGPVLRISEASNLAVHALAVLAGAGEERFVSAAEIARRLGRSASHLAKVLNLLAAHGLVVSSRGARGGFRLARDAGEIRVLDVIDLVDGPRASRSCLLGEPICRPEHCLFGGVFKDVEMQALARLRTTTLRDFRARGARRDERRIRKGEGKR